MAASGRVPRIHADMATAVEEAVAAMTWLQTSDRALVALARRYAAELDAAGDDGRAVGYLGQQLTCTLKALGGAPIERRALDAKPKPIGTVASLRAARATRSRQRSAPVVDAASAEADPE